MAAAAALMMSAPALAEAAPGDLDPGFGVGGLVHFDGGYSDIVVDGAGNTFILAGEDFRVIGLSPTGAPLPGFLDGSGRPGKAIWPGGYGEDLSIADDGTLLAAGSRPGGNLALAEFGPGGNLRTAFGSGGRIEVELDNPTRGPTGGRIAPDGRVLAYADPTGETPYRFAVFAFDQNGDPDLGFSGDGVMRVEGYHGGYTPATMDLAIDSQGRALVAGSLPNLWVARITTAGELDPAFADGGIRYDTSDDWPSLVALAIDAADRTIVLSSVDETTLDFSWRSRLQRLSAAGEPDPGFGGSTGIAAIAQGTNQPLDDLALLDHGRIALAGAVGYSGYHSIGHIEGAVFVLGPGGGLDPGFGQGGRVVNYSDVGAAAIAAGDGSIHGASVRGALRLLDVAGPADRDADAIGDAVDRCPGAFSPSAPGCPSFGRRFTAVDKEPSSTAAMTVFGGIATDGPAECVYGEDFNGYRVSLYRKKKGPDKLVARGYANGDYFSNHAWAFDVTRQGRYYAKTPARTFDNYGICERAKSRLVRVTTIPH